MTTLHFKIIAKSRDNENTYLTYYCNLGDFWSVRTIAVVSETISIQFDFKNRDIELSGVWKSSVADIINTIQKLSLFPDADYNKVMEMLESLSWKIIASANLSM